MTYEKALNRFKQKYELIKDYYDPHWEGSEYREHREWVEQIETAISAIEKQIPQAAEHEDGAWSICPNCGGSICNDTEHATNKEVSYCEHCGQAIDWENSEME